MKPIVRASTCLALVLLLGPPAAAQEEVPPEAAAPQPQAQGSTKNPAGMRKLFAIMKEEPTVKQVQTWAVKHYKLEPDRIHAMGRHARLKALFPDLTFSVTNMIGNTFQNTKDGLYPQLPSFPENPNPNSYKERQAGGSDEFTWSVSARFGLDRLLFSSEALDAKSLTSLEENLVREVTTLYFARRRVLASIVLSPPNEDEDYFYELVRLDELTATLDAFTGGRYGKAAWDWQAELIGK